MVCVLLALRCFCLFLYLLTVSYSCIMRPSASWPEAPNTREAREQEAFFNSHWWDDAYVMKFSDLPSRGKARRQPYSGYWYPYNKGGTATVLAHGGETALRKYDRAFGTKALSWEQRYHSDANAPRWTGHCHGFAAASQLLPAPLTKVTKGGVTFTPAEIKTLLAELHAHAEMHMLGGRRCNNVNMQNAIRGVGSTLCPPGFISTMTANRSLVCIPAKDLSTQELNSCEDVNAGTFHLALANWVGRREQIILFDEESGQQVWNYPLFEYTVGDKSGYISKENALRLVSQYHRPAQPRGYYPFNRKATSFYYTEMHVSYAKSVDETDAGELHVGGKVYTYILEIDNFGDIVGGEWVGNSYRDHPDFLWIALEPRQSLTEDEARQRLLPHAFQIYRNTVRTRSNPYLQVDTVLDLWAASIGEEPGYRLDPIELPDHSAAWGRGKGQRFSVLLDGDINGSVFLGKEIALTVTLMDAQDRDSVQVSVNNSTIEPDSRSNLVLNFVVSPRPGLNILRIAFDDTGSSGEEKFIFHAVL